jgi:hypothetical protein
LQGLFVPVENGQGDNRECTGSTDVYRAKATKISTKQTTTPVYLATSAEMNAKESIGSLERNNILCTETALHRS